MRTIENLLRAPATLVFLVVALASTATALAFVVGRLVRHRPVLPNVGTPRVPWGMGLTFLAIFLWMLLQRVVVVGFVWLRKAPANPDGTPATLSPLEMVLLTLAGNALVLIVVPWVLAQTSGARPRDFGLVTDQVGANLLRGYLGCWLTLPAVYACYWLTLQVFQKNTHAMEGLLRADLPWTTTALGTFSAVVSAPLVEELLFRGIFMAGQARLFEGSSGECETTASRGTWWDWRPCVFSALFWAAIHVENWPAPVPLLVLGLALGWLYERTGSLVAPVALHATFNGISTVWVLLGSVTGPGDVTP